jgi:hypothetical protein
MLAEDKYFKTLPQDELWQRYCGFLDLSIDEFMEIQEELLIDQLAVVGDSPLGRKIMAGQTPRDVAEFRRVVPLTTYQDYAPHIGDCQEDKLAEKPYFWGHTSGRGGSLKWVPCTYRAMEVACKNTMAAFILASAKKRGDVNFTPGTRVLVNLPARPYMSACLGYSLTERFSMQLIPPQQLAEKMEFMERIENSFLIALRTGVDHIGSMSSILVKIGERFAGQGRNTKLSLSMLHPAILPRLLRAWLRSKLKRRALIPSDLWTVKGIVGWGMDTAFYKEQVERFWGTTPLETYIASEVGYIALASWAKKSLTFLPDSAFLEFIPEGESLKSRYDTGYKPTTVLLDEVKEQASYEIVITSFYGVPFLRYRLGDLIKIVSLEDEEAGISLPQMVFKSRADDIIDLAGFTRLDEKAIWQAIANTGIRYEDWTIRKEYEQDKVALHLYIELKEDRSPEEMSHLIHEQLKLIDKDYMDLEAMLKVQPLQVTLLSTGTFSRYLEEQQRKGVDLAHLKPRHTNVEDSTVQTLLRINYELSHTEL